MLFLLDAWKIKKITFILVVKDFFRQNGSKCLIIGVQYMMILIVSPYFYCFFLFEASSWHFVNLTNVIKECGGNEREFCWENKETTYITEKIEFIFMIQIIVYMMWLRGIQEENYNKPIINEKWEAENIWKR